MLIYVAIVAVGAFAAFKTGSFWAVLATIGALGLYTFIRTVIRMSRDD